MVGLEGAGQVCGDASMLSMHVVDRLGSLVDKSLVVAGDRDGRRRFDLLETVRAYAAEFAYRREGGRNCITLKVNSA